MQKLQPEAFENAQDVHTLFSRAKGCIVIVRMIRLHMPQEAQLHFTRPLRAILEDWPVLDHFHTASCATLSRV